VYKRNLLLFGAFLVILLVTLYFANGMLRGLTKLNATDVVARQQTGYQKKAKADQNQSDNKTATVFIHGENGNERTFRPMIQRLGKINSGLSTSRIIRVTADNKISVSGHATPGRIPLIQIVFADSRGTLQQQTGWLNTAFRYLKKNENISRMNVVAHSMGGEAFVAWLEQAGNRNDFPETMKFIPIAVPLDGSSGPRTESAVTLNQLKQSSPLYQKKSRIPSAIKVLAIAGVVGSKEQGDGQVPLRSALFGKYLFNPKNYSEKIIYGPQAAHSKLQEDTAADQQVADFLWKNNTSE
jgi:Uncharacterized protein with an alpha/beta hydrolase fold